MCKHEVLIWDLRIHVESQMPWHIPVISVLRKQRREDSWESGASQSK